MSSGIVWTQQDPGTLRAGELAVLKVRVDEYTVYIPARLTEQGWRHLQADGLGCASAAEAQRVAERAQWEQDVA